MEKYVELTKEYLKGRRDKGKPVFYLVGRIYRGINNNRFIWEQVEKKLFGKEEKI